MVEPSKDKVVSEELEAIMAQSLRKDRWEGVNLGDDENYANKTIVDRWETERQIWCTTKIKGPDVRKEEPPCHIPDEYMDKNRRAIKRVFKSVVGPYPRFASHYPLEEAIDLYVEIWNDSDSSSDF